GGTDLSLTVDTDETLYFRALSLDAYHAEQGWQERSNVNKRLHPAFECERGCVNVRMAVQPNGRPITIPVPTGYRLDPESVRWTGGTPRDVFLDDAGAASLTLNGTQMGLLSYEVGPAEIDFQGSSDVPRGAPLTREWRQVLKDHRSLRARTPRRRRRSNIELAESVTNVVRNRIRYDVSEGTARRFEQHPGFWTDRVIATGAGDCDVKNGLNVLLFRHLGIPARLAVGIVAVNGRARGGLHAWTEYHAKDRWWVADATGRPAPPRNTVPRVGGPALETAPATVEVRDVQPARRGRAPASARETVTAIDAPAPVTTELEPALAPPPVAEEPVPGPESVAPSVPPWLLGLLLAAGVGATVVGIRRRRRIDETLERRGEGPEQRAAVAGMVRELLRGSAGWRGVSALGHRRLLPTLKGPPMSLAEAMERSRRGRLWGGGRRSLLARSAAASGYPVLDIEDRHFGPLVRQTFDVVDLSMIEELQPARLPEALARALNPLLEQHGRITCLWSRHLGDRALIEYDISELKLRDSQELPRRAIVINPDHPEVRARIDVFERDPRRAAYGWVDWLVSRSMSCEPYASKLRRHAASLVFAEDAA
ncbi:MAG: transglutaminase-like domain-containing protein, partial [Myxococcota bacterium]